LSNTTKGTGFAATNVKNGTVFTYGILATHLLPLAVSVFTKHHGSIKSNTCWTCRRIVVLFHLHLLLHILKHHYQSIKKRWRAAAYPTTEVVPFGDKTNIVRICSSASMQPDYHMKVIIKKTFSSWNTTIVRDLHLLLISISVDGIQQTAVGPSMVRPTAPANTQL
jgi:hypothetical protein